MIRVAFIVGVDQSGRTMAIAAGGDTAPFAEFPAGMLERAGARLVPGAHPLRVTRLDAYDLYYYARAPHTMLGQQDRRLPASAAWRSASAAW